MKNIKSDRSNDGALSISLNTNGKDNYDYKTRAALIRKKKEEMGLKNIEPIQSPWTLEIEPTLYCNSSCYFCSYQEDIKRNKRKKVSLELGAVINVLESVKEAGMTKGTYWSGGGEAMMWPYFSEAVKYAATFSDVFLQTNGILLKKFLKNPENINLLRLVSVSMFSDNPCLYKSISGVDAFDNVVKGIDRFVLIKKSLKINSDLNIKIMVGHRNYQRVPEIVKFYEDKGVDSIGIRLLQDYNYGGPEKRIESVELDKHQKEELLESINKLNYINPSLKRFAETLFPDDINLVTTKHCYNATDGHFACIDAFGNVFLGNPEIGKKIFQIGNINKSTWPEIWKSKQHYEVIDKMDRMQQDGVCNNSLCRHVKANIGAEEYLSGRRPIIELEKDIMYNMGAFL